MNSGVYGKKTENLRNKLDVRLVNNEKGYSKWTSKRSHVAQRIFGNDLVAIHKIKTTLTLNKPAYFGMFIFELCKVIMYESHYNYIKNRDGSKSKLFFTDTHNLVN